jgi:Skp family chaperone for outer membrane proteins
VNYDDARAELARTRRKIGRLRAAVAWFTLASFVVLLATMAFNASEVARFAAAAGFRDADGSPSPAAWALDPIVGFTLLVVMAGESIIASQGQDPPKIGALVRHGAAFATLAMSCWPSLENGAQPAAWDGVLLHAILPGLLIGFAAAAPRFRTVLAQISDDLRAEVEQIEAQIQAHAAQAGEQRRADAEREAARREWQRQEAERLARQAEQERLDAEHRRQLELLETEARLRQADEKPKPRPRAKTATRTAGGGDGRLLTATTPVDGEGYGEKRARLADARTACVDEVREKLAAGVEVTQQTIAACYGAGSSWASEVRAEAGRPHALPSSAAAR